MFKRLHEIYLEFEKTVDVLVNKELAASGVIDPRAFEAPEPSPP